FRHLGKLLLTMKLILAFVLLSVNVALCEYSYAQKTMLTLRVNNKSVAQVLDEIEKQSEFRFFYNSKLVDVDRMVSVNIRTKAVMTILKDLFRGTDVSYSVVEKDVILKPRE